MADGKRRYKSDRKDHKVSVKLSEKDMDILKAALNRTGMTASAYIRELIRTGGNIDTSYPEDRAKAIRIIAGIANNINQTVKLGNSQGRLYYSDIDKLQNSLDDVKKTFRCDAGFLPSDSCIFKIFVIAILPAPPRMFSLHHPDCSAIYQYRCNTISPVNCQALPSD